MISEKLLILCLRQQKTRLQSGSRIQTLPDEKENTIMKGEMTQKGREALDRFKMESASEVGVSLNKGYNGDLTSRQAGSIGGQMVKKMIDAYKMQ